MKLQMEGAAQYKADLQNITQRSKELASEMQAIVSGANDQASKTKNLTAQIENQKSKMELLNKQYTAQAKTLEQLNKDLETAKREHGENSAEVQKLTQQITKQETAMSKTRTELNKAETELNSAAKAMDELGDETKETAEQTEDAEKQFSGVTTAVGKVGKGIAEATAAIAAAATAAAAAVWKMATATSEAGDEIDKESQKLGISTENYQELSYAMERSGSSISDLSKGVKTITSDLADAQNGVEGADEAFTAIGVSLKRSNGTWKTTEEVLLDSIDALANMEDETLRNAAAQDIFGKSSMELAPLLNEGADGIKALMQEAEDYGMVMSDDAVKASAKFQDSLTRLKKTVSGLKNNLMAEFLPALTDVSDGLAKIAIGDESGIEQMISGIESAVDRIAQMAPEMLKAGGKIILAIANGITQNLAKISETLFNVALSAVEYLVTHSGELINALLGVLEVAVNFIADHAGDIAVAMIDLATQVVTKLIEKAPALLASLAKGIVTAIPKAFEAVVTSIGSIIGSIFSTLSGTTYLKEWEDKVNGLVESWDGIISKRDELISNADKEYGYYSGLWSQLNSIVDENGKIKEGYEERAKFITEELGKYTGLAIEIIDGEIKGYQDLKKSIHDVIEEQRTQTILAAEREAYEAATKAVEDQTAAMNELSKAIEAQEERRKDAEIELQRIRADTRYYDELDVRAAEVRLEKEGKTLDALKADYNDLAAVLEENLRAQEQYLTDYQRVSEGNYAAVGKAVVNFGQVSEEEKQRVIDGLEAETDSLKIQAQTWEKIYNDTGSETSRIQLETIQASIKNNEDYLDAMTKDWDAYAQDVVKNLDDATPKISRSAEIIAQEVQRALTNGWESGLTVEEAVAMGKDTAQGIINGLYAKLQDLKSAGRTVANTVEDAYKVQMSIQSPSKEMEEAGEYTISGLIRGIENMRRALIDSVIGVSDIVSGSMDSTSAGALIGSSRSIYEAAAAGSQTTNEYSINMTINGAEGQDVSALADEVAGRIQMMIDRRGAVYA
jgi:DNA repair exonuclease SbcCD ATPase subunit